MKLIKISRVAKNQMMIKKNEADKITKDQKFATS